jgi:hypothetical protein
MSSYETGRGRGEDNDDVLYNSKQPHPAIAQEEEAKKQWNIFAHTPLLLLLLFLCPLSRVVYLLAYHCFFVRHCCIFPSLAFYAFPFHGTV